MKKWITNISKRFKNQKTDSEFIEHFVVITTGQIEKIRRDYWEETGNKLNGYWYTESTSKAKRIEELSELINMKAKGKFFVRVYGYNNIHIELTEK